MRARARACARENPFFSVMVNVGEVMVPLVGANLQLEISTFFTIYSAAGPGLPLLGHHHQNFPWNPQFLAEFKNFTFFPTQLEKLERLVLVPWT